MSVFDEINALSAEEVLSRINLPLAKDGKSYVCPLCGNGATGDPRHGHGDGIRPRINSKGQVRWKCHKCDKDFSNFDLAAATLGLDSERDTAESARRVAELFGIKESEKAFSSSKGKKSARTAWTAEKRAALCFETKGVVEMDEKKSASEKEPKNYAKLYEFCRGNVAKFLEENGGSFRGLTASTFEKYKLGIHSEFGVEGHEKCPHLIIPYDDTHFTARAIEGHDRSQHGANAGLYETLPIKGCDENTSCLNFFVESEIDALSIAQVFGQHDDMFGCAATGGASKYHKIVSELEKRFGSSASKPPVIIMFDNDKAGKINALKAVAECRSAGYPTEPYFIKGETKIDANDLLKQNEKKLIEFIWNAVTENEWKLKAQAEAMKKSVEQARQAAMDKSGMKIFSFKDYFAADFFSDIKLTAKYAERKTGFKNIDTAAQVFMPGLYVLGALPATGKTTFAWQLLNQLADGGETCIYCSYEMSRAELFTKSIARELYKRYPKTSEQLNLSSVNIRRGACSNMKELQEQATAFVQSSTNLQVAELSNTSIAELIEKLKPLIAGTDKSPVICLDYLQIVPAKDVKTASAKEKVDDIMLRLKDFQRETNSTLIVISSFNRDNYYKPASFSSFKESGAIEYSADVIWCLEIDAFGGSNQEDATVKTKIAEMSKEKVRDIKLSCLKNRNGGQYECFFKYHAAHDYFEPREKEKEQPECYDD